MNPPTATIIELSTGYALLRVDAVSCSRCRAGKGCGAGLFASARAGQELRVSVESSTVLRVGQRVSLALVNGRMIRASLYLYGLPLAGLLLGAVLGGPVLSGGESLAIAASAAGLLGGGLCGRYLSRNDRSVAAMQPVIVAGSAQSPDDDSPGPAREAI